MQFAFSLFLFVQVYGCYLSIWKVSSTLLACGALVALAFDTVGWLPWRALTLTPRSELLAMVDLSAKYDLDSLTSLRY